MQALITICLALGIRKATSTLIKFPAFVLTPAFTFWTFGPVASTSCCIYRKNEQKIHLSYRLTWINAFLTSFIAGGLLAYRVEISNHYELRGVLPSIVIGFGITLALLALSFLTLIFIQCPGKCSCLCCSESCLPMKPKAIYNTETEENC